MGGTNKNDQATKVQTPLQTYGEILCAERI